MPLFLLPALAAAAQPASPPPPCNLPHPVAPDADAAERIARAVIDARPGWHRRPYYLEIWLDPEDHGKWRVFQTFAERRLILPHAPYKPARRRSVHMRIDRCTGAASRLEIRRL